MTCGMSYFNGVNTDVYIIYTIKSLKHLSTFYFACVEIFNYCFTDSLPYITNKHDFCRKNICYSRYKALENTTYFFNANISILATVSYTTLLRDSVAIRLCFFVVKPVKYTHLLFFLPFYVTKREIV